MGSKKIMEVFKKKKKTEEQESMSESCDAQGRKIISPCPSEFLAETPCNKRLTRENKYVSHVSMGNTQEN